ncbi:MAG: rhodanese-like domain-containing protein [Rhodothalassiaceae bacterium]
MRFLLVFAFFLSAVPATADTLSHIAERIANNSEVPQQSPTEVAQALDHKDVLLLDVREEAEFAVSHLPGAMRVDPALSGDEFLRLYGQRIEGKRLIFYCSIGRRSTTLAERVMQAGLPTHRLANLKGGIFRWHGEGLPLVNAAGPTDHAHPYNWFWKQVMPRAEAAAYSPAYLPSTSQ